MRIAAAFAILAVLLSACGKKDPGPSAGGPPPGPGAAGAVEPRGTPVADLAALPALPTGERPVAASTFEPSGARFPDGLEVSWTLASPRPAGTELWIQVLDPETRTWYPTGELATVSADGVSARGRVRHFSEIGLTDTPGFVTEWVWLAAEYPKRLKRLAREMSDKYRQAFELPETFRLTIEEWMDESGSATLSHVETWTGVPRPMSVEVKRTHCLLEARQEFRRMREALETAFASSLRNWLAAVERGDAASVAALWAANADLKRLAKELGESPDPSVPQAAWAKLKDTAWESARDKAFEAAERIWIIRKIFRNPLLKWGVEKAADNLGPKEAFTDRLHDFLGKPGQGEATLLAEQQVKLADIVTMSLCFNRNHGKEGTFLNAEPGEHWELTRESLEAMTACREFTVGETAKVAPLVGKKFATKEAFAGELERIFTPEEAEHASKAVVSLAHVSDDPVVRESYFELGGPVTDAFDADAAAAGLSRKYHCAISLAAFEPVLLGRVIGHMTWIHKGDSRAVDASWLDAFENRRARTHPFRFQDGAALREVEGTTGPPGPGDGNFPELRRRYERERAVVRAEAARGEAAFYRALSGGTKSAPLPRKLMALAVVRLFLSDVKRHMAADWDRWLKEKATDLLAERFGKLLVGEEEWFKAVLKRGIQAGADKLAPDPLAQLSKDLDLATARIVADLGIDPGIPPEFAAGKAGLDDMMTLRPDLPACCSAAGPVREFALKLKASWEGDVTTSFTVRISAEVPDDLEAIRGASETWLREFSPKWVKATATCGGRTFTFVQPLGNTGVGTDMLTLIGGIVPVRKPGTYTLRVSIPLNGQNLSVEKTIVVEDLGWASNERDLETARGELKKAMERLEKAKEEVRRELDGIATEKAEHEAALNDRDLTPESKALHEKGIAGCDERLAKGREILRQLEGGKEGNDWVRGFKDDVARAHGRIGSAHTRLEQWAEARAAWNDALSWGHDEASAYGALAQVALGEVNLGEYRSFMEKAGFEPDFPRMSELELLHHGDIGTARGYMREAARRMGLPPDTPSGLPPENAEFAK